MNVDISSASGKTTAVNKYEFYPLHFYNYDIHFNMNLIYALNIEFLV